MLGQYLASSRAVNGSTVKFNIHSCAGLWQVVTLIAGKRRRLLFAGDGRRNVYDEKQEVSTLRRRQQNSIVRSGKSEAEVTDNKQEVKVI